MDLNFEDPPIPADWSEFEPRITAEATPGALAQAAARMRSNEGLNTAFRGDQIEPLASSVEDPDTAAVYASGVPMIARFLTIELDTEHVTGKGIGRVSRGDPPPRFGEKYRKKLRDPTIAAELGTVVENLALHGFAAHAAVNASVDEPAQFQERGLPERWRLLVRNLTPTWNTLVEQLNLDPQSPNPLALLTFGVMQPAADEYVLLAERVGLGRRRPFGSARMVTYMHFFLALGWLVFDTGTDRATGAID